MELKQLRYFVVLAETLHFGRAAERLGIGQPVLSRLIQELERELGRSLLDRDGGSLRLSDNGRSFADGARRILGDPISPKDTRDFRPPDRGVAAAVSDTISLRVGQLASATSRFVPRMLALFQERHPEHRLQLSTGSSPEHLAAVRSRSCDIAFIRLPLETDESMDHVVLEDEPLRVVVAPSNPLAARSTVTAKELLQQPFVFFPRAMNPELHHDILQRLEQSGGARPNIVAEAPTLESYMSSVLICNAASVVTTAHAHDAPRYGLSVRNLSPRQGIRLGLVWRRDALSPPLKAFLRVAQGLAPADLSALALEAREALQTQ